MNETKLRAALEDAEALIGRIQEVVADHLSRRGGLDETRAFYDVVGILDTAGEITRIRVALGLDPTRVGEETPLAHGMHTG